jgi:hypothetical protein
MDLRDALTRIAELRETAEESGEFRGYRAMPVAASGLAAIVAALLQSRIVGEPPAEHPLRFVLYWTVVAIVAAAPSAVRIYLRDWRAAHSVGRRVTRLAVGQFLPCLAAGALATIAIVRHSPETAWALPGLWPMLFSLGIFASCRLMPPGLVWVGVFYLAAGAWSLAYGRGDLALHPWLMGVPFGAGQFATAAILAHTEERHRDRETD